MDRFIREEECRRITGLGRTTRWELERAGKFPVRRRLTGNAVGWLASEIKRWMRSRHTGTHAAPLPALTARFTGKPPARTRARKARLRARAR